MDLFLAAAAAMSLLVFVAGYRRLRASQEAGKVLERLGASSARRVRRNRGPLAEGVATKFAATLLGARLAGYAGAAHPGALFSDVVVWGVVALLGGGLFGIVLFGRAVPAILMAVAGPVVVDRYLVKRRGSRGSRLEKQLPDALRLQASALRSGQSLTRSLGIVAEGSKAPLNDELERMLNHVDLGTPMDEALEQLAARAGRKDLDLWVDAMLVHRQSGGNLANVIDSLAGRISQRMNLRSEIRAMTAQGRMSGLVVAAAPLAFFLILSIGSRDQMEMLYTTPLGLVVLFTGLTLNGLGLLWIKLVLRIRP